LRHDTEDDEEDDENSNSGKRTNDVTLPPELPTADSAALDVFWQPQ
jgi:hypothetical protein